MCNYCKEYEQKLLINTRTKLSLKRDSYPGVELYVEDGELWVFAVSDTYEPGCLDEHVKINFCPMCGRKLDKE